MATSIPSFMDQLRSGWANERHVCVGLDPDPGRLPDDLELMDPGAAVVELNRRIVVATADVALAYKPQSACYEILGAEGARALETTIALIRTLAPGVPVIYDAKRGDVPNTSSYYAKAAFDQLGVDAITVNPYLGLDGAQPFLDHADKGVILLCRTSNPGARRMQDLTVDGRPLYQHVAADIAEEWNANGNCALVVGATYPAEVGEIRSIAPALPFLVPGAGSQGGNVQATVTAGRWLDGGGLIISSSRGIMYAYESGDRLDVVDAARNSVLALHEQIANAHRNS